MTHKLIRQKVGQMQQHEKLPTRSEPTEQEKRNARVRMLLISVLDFEMGRLLAEQLAGLGAEDTANVLDDWLMRLEYA